MKMRSTQIGYVERGNTNEKIYAPKFNGNDGKWEGKKNIDGSGFLQSLGILREKAGMDLVVRFLLHINE